jgi:hypothetical protein
MIPINQAVDKAVMFARGVLDPARTASILLEEVEAGTAGGNDVWLITLSLPEPQLSPFVVGHRQYKTFTVDGETGEVLSMKIKQLSGVT